MTWLVLRWSPSLPVLAGSEVLGRVWPLPSATGAAGLSSINNNINNTSRPKIRKTHLMKAR
jgi:hypothetical protein